MKITTKSISSVPESLIGLYVWKMPSGNLLGDTDRNILNIPAERGDISKMAQLQSAAHYWLKAMGLPLEGSVEFIESYRCTEEEYQEQVSELQQGYVPDYKVRKKF